MRGGRIVRCRLLLALFRAGVAFSIPLVLDPFKAPLGTIDGVGASSALARIFRPRTRHAVERRAMTVPIVGARRALRRGRGSRGRASSLVIWHAPKLTTGPTRGRVYLSSAPASSQGRSTEIANGRICASASISVLPRRTPASGAEGFRTAEI
jgi:hypothetical protein